MLAYGYPRDSEAELPIKLSETTLLCTKEELDSVICFLKSIQKTCQEYDSVAGLHMHFRDFDRRWESKQSDIIICLTDEKKP